MNHDQTALLAIHFLLVIQQQRLWGLPFCMNNTNMFPYGKTYQVMR